MSCTCSNGGTFTNGVCEETVVAQNCTVGMIYYSDKSCSEDVDASKTAIGIVVKDNELIAALNVPDMTWSADWIDVTGVTNISSSATAKTDYNGKVNTLAMLEAYPSDTTSYNAAVYCHSYSTAGTSVGDWYLPATGEVYDYIYTNYLKVKSGWDKVGTTTSNSWFWSSSEYSYDGAWGVLFSSGRVDWLDKTGNYYSVSCLLAIN